MSIGDPIRVGVIGCGQFMRRQHIQTIARCPRLVLQSLADSDEEALRGVAEQYGPRRTSLDWRDVVSDPDVDVVVVGVIPQLHPQMARAALEHGKPVYVEKPLAPTSGECVELDRLARERRLGLAVGFNRRFAPAAEVLAQAFAARRGPASVFYRICDDERIRPPQQRWKLTDRLLIEVVHVFDLLAWLLGSEPLRVYASQSRPNEHLVTLEFDDGSRAGILSSGHGSLAAVKEHLEAVLEHGQIEMDDFVEVRARAIPGLAPVMRFAGRAYDGCNNAHVDDFARRGLPALFDLRQRYEAAARQSGVLDESGDPTAWQRFADALGDPPLPQINYASDKGWGAALERFCMAVAQGGTPPNASALAGNRATACALAARDSIASGLPVQLRPDRWQDNRE